MGQQLLLIVHILLALAIIGLILLQHGKGAEVGAAFGSGASQTFFGSKGSASFLAKLTAVFAICFAITSLSMGYVTTSKSKASSILDKIEEVHKAEEIPSFPGSAEGNKTQSEEIPSFPAQTTESKTQSEEIPSFPAQTTESKTQSEEIPSFPAQITESKTQSDGQDK